MALGKSSPLDKPAKNYNELFDENGEPIYNLTNISMANMASPYYGGNEKMQAEIEKAKNYGASRGKQFADQTKEAYDKFYDPVLAQFDRASSSYKNKARPEGEEGGIYPFVKVKGGEYLAKERDKLKLYKSNSMTPDDKKKFEEFMKVNAFTPESYEKSLGKDYVASATEHEIGHHFTGPFAYGDGGPMYAVKNTNEEGAPSNYMAEPSELVNVVGRIQRERFKKGEGRFEGENDLKDYVRKTPYDKAIQGYSPEAIRGWKALYEEQDASKPDVKWLLDYASQLAPAVVKNNRKTGLGSYS